MVLGTFGNFYSVLGKVKSTMPPQFNRPDVLSSASDREKLFAC